MSYQIDIMPIHAIRQVEQSDIEEILKIYTPYIKNSATSFETTVPTDEDFVTRVNKIASGLPFLVYEYHGKIAAYAYACDHRKREAYNCSKELSVYVKEQFQRRGIAKALYTAVIEIMKLMGYTNALAGVVTPNESSVRFHQRMGFKIVGTYHNVGYKFGQFCNVTWFECQFSDKNESFQPKRFSSIYGTPQWYRILTKSVEIVDLPKH